MSENIIFGCNKRSDIPDDHVEDLWATKEVNEYFDVKKAVLEAQSKRAKPQQSRPSFIQDPEYRHGVTTSKAADDAKKLIYTDETCEVNEPWSQRKRNYNWPMNPETTTFGVKSKGGAGTSKGSSGVGVAEALYMDDSDVVETETIAHKPEKVFGKSTSSSDSSTAECLGFTKGAKDGTREEDKDTGDDDIGKSLKPGYRNVLTARSFGCPSIRTDIPNNSRSVADSQNYGQDASAGDLLRPSLLSSLGLEESEFIKPRSKGYLKKLFDSCDMNIDAVTFEEIFRMVCDGNNLANIQIFMHTYATKIVG